MNANQVAVGRGHKHPVRAFHSPERRHNPASQRMKKRIALTDGFSKQSGSSLLSLLCGDLVAANEFP